VARAVRYPPQGGRSFGGSLAIHYGGDFDTWINREIFLAVQIESAQAVAHADGILAVEGVDGCWIGPNDLARSLGVAQNTPTHTEAILSVIAACRRTNKILGISAAAAERWIGHGCLFVTAGGDAAMVASGGRATLRFLGRGSGIGVRDHDLQSAICNLQSANAQRVPESAICNL